MRRKRGKRREEKRRHELNESFVCVCMSICVCASMKEEEEEEGGRVTREQGENLTG